MDLDTLSTNPPPASMNLDTMFQDLQTKVDGYEKGKQGVRALLRDIRAMTARPDSLFDPAAALHLVEDLAVAARKEKHRKADEFEAAVDEVRLRRFHKNWRSAMKDIFATESERKYTLIMTTHLVPLGNSRQTGNEGGKALASWWVLLDYKLVHTCEHWVHFSYGNINSKRLKTLHIHMPE
uniref:Uncharacterized protein n=1 Tax=Branchiostoma floridae TaxID=7739 RepID=C3YFJ9_BRAFL|eukprot:XP_002604952.1 hypothetical protein BRAFLDRAFT_92592 [Branchiostoma floridae]